MRICSCKTSVTSQPQSLFSHSPIVTVTMKIIGGPPELSKHDLSINSAEEIVDCKEYLPYHLYTKIAFCMQPKRFISDSLLALCTAITAIEIKLCNRKLS